VDTNAKLFDNRIPVTIIGQHGRRKRYPVVKTIAAKTYFGQEFKIPNQGVIHVHDHLVIAFIYLFPLKVRPVPRCGEGSKRLTIKAANTGGETDED